jgi:hypothetical protein
VYIFATSKEKVSRDAFEKMFFLIVKMEPREILLKRLDETTIDDLRKLNAVLFPVKYAVSVVLSTIKRAV